MHGEGSDTDGEGLSEGIEGDGEGSDEGEGNDDWEYISDEENIENMRKLKTVDNVFNLMNKNDGFEADVEHTYASDYENENQEYVSGDSDSDFQSKMRKRRVVEALTTWAIENGRYIRFRAVSKKKILAKCTSPCPWKVWASIVPSNGTFMIKSYVGDHNCPKAMSNKLLSSQRIAHRYLNVYRVRYNLCVKELGADILERFKVRVPKDRLYKARRIAQEMVRGSIEEHYAFVKNYVAELLRVDEEGRYELVLEADSVFKSLYIGMNSLRKGFKTSCRPVIGIDGCFLKTYLGGHLLCATAKDGNNGMFPIAWAVVEAENEVCWTWFLRLLLEDLDVGDVNGWCFVSDQQKGLQNAVATLDPQAEHRNCARHIYMNWKKDFKGQTLKNMFFKAVYATHEADFKLAVQAMKEESVAAYEDFMARDTKKFCKAFISTNPKSDSVDNNISECFNGYILNVRGKHVIHMLEEIRSSLMVRQNKCSCREWDLTEIPCKHAIAAIRYMERDPTDFISSYYTVETYLSSYEFGIKPIVGMKMWPEVEGGVVKPPPKAKMPGRPKKKRVRVPHEKDGRMSKHGVVISCSNCKQQGHNKRKCTATPVEESKGEKHGSSKSKKVFQMRKFKKPSSAHEKSIVTEVASTQESRNEAGSGQPQGKN
ncbi:uncharacterized protein LOC131008423 [Salvia miltiorrhiza]|uniref:uncharacterized protein LOC131008423 n=1 Tax=Salvia miltiorrhiza TaxID=226208 RepID=UPI0025ABF146|nr:uncharacterized protein LOC131008423 [Salvia miltiorrhiza]